jgi:Fur family transcriptional regulator, ferric uptake regulator
MPRGQCRHMGWWHGKFKGCGYRMTQGREAILQVLSDSKGHLSAEDIYLKVHSQYPQIGLTSVYRTLDVLSSLGSIHKFDFGEGRSRYEMADGPSGKDHHHHLVCTSCHQVINYTDFIDEEIKLLKQTEKGLEKKYRFKITSHTIQFHGVCGDCQKKESTLVK